MMLALLAATSASAQFDDELGALNPDTLQLLQASKQPDAIAVAESALAAAERQFGPDHPNVARSLTNLGKQYQYHGKYDQAEPLYQRALAIKENLAIKEMVSRPDHADIAVNLDGLATLYRIRHRYADAETLLKRSLAVREQAFGPDGLNVCPSLESLAVLYQSEGRHGDAEPYLRRVLAIREKALGPDHPQVGQSLHQLARLYRMQGRLPEARTSYDRAVALLGSNHPEAILAAVVAGDYAAAARAIGRKDLTGAKPETLVSVVRPTFLGQVTDLRWTRSSAGKSVMMIEGEAAQANQLWQPFVMFMARDGAEWTLRSIQLSGLAWK
jgi:tetratricopeptide (TPR) repeat protein